MIDGWGIALRRMSLDFTDKSTLVQVMAWCRQATSHYLSQYWPRSLSPYGITKPPWVKPCCVEYLAVFKCVEYILTHWGWDRMGTILQTSFSIHFLERKFCYIDGNFMESISALAEEMQTWRRLLRHAIDLQDLQFRCFCGSSGLHVPQSFCGHWKLLSAKQVTGHYLNQCWSRIVIQDITVTRPQWFNPVVLTLLTKLHFHCFSKVWSMASKVHIHACGITMPGLWAVIQVCSTPLCMVQCTHLITTGGNPTCIIRGPSMQVNSLHSGANNI